MTADVRTQLELAAEAYAHKAHNQQRTAKDPTTRNGDRHTDVGNGAPLKPWTDVLTVARRWSDLIGLGDSEGFYHNPEHREQYGYQSAAGENIAAATIQPARYGTPTRQQVVATTEQMMQGWWNSDGHRRNWMRPGWDHFAVGASVRTTNICFGDGGCDDYWQLTLTTNFRTASGTVPSDWCGFSADGSLPPNEGDGCTGTAAKGPTGKAPRFSDVPFDHMFHDNIEGLAKSGVTKGCGTTKFCPERQLTRGEMAAFLDRWLHLPDGTTTFRDSKGHMFEQSIAALGDAGITEGCGGNNFCPDRLLSRGEMAAFFDRALNLADGTARFHDTRGHMFEQSIAALAEAGITKGCGGNGFCPDRKITRQEMAAFIDRVGYDH